MINKLPNAFLEYMQGELKEEYDEFLSSYNQPPQKAIRVNTLKIAKEQFVKTAPFCLSQVEWEENGFYIEEDKPGKFIEHFLGLYYCQEPSAMCAVPLLDYDDGDIVLDMCSAPGGKGTQFAQKMCGHGIIVLNEINAQRAKILSSNVERLGIKNAIVTCLSPQELVEKFGAIFNKIIVDAPCSGEGMFKKEQLAIENWSEANVKLCISRQKQILNCAYNLLAPEGTMVYSTCTFNRGEDEDMVEWFCSEYPVELISSHKLYPHKVKGEGHFAALIKKGESERQSIQRNAPSRLTKLQQQAWLTFASDSLTTQFNNLFLIRDNLFALPEKCIKIEHISRNVLRCGVHLGTFIKDRFEPSHSLAMALNKNYYKNVDIDYETAQEYMRGQTFTVDERLKGWHIVTYNGYPMGWCKCVCGIAKNHLPKGLRV